MCSVYFELKNDAYDLRQIKIVRKILEIVDVIRGNIYQKSKILLFFNPLYFQFI